MCWIFPEEDIKISKFSGWKVHLENWISDDFFREKCKVSPRPFNAHLKGENPFVSLQ